MKPYYQDDLITIYHADCREILPTLRGISAVVTDPPYGLGFMGKEWDKKGVSFQADTWRLISEACLPGAPLLSFGGTRTSHRLACAIEDAGWQIRDTIMWVYGSGFPKSLDICKAIDKQKGAKREIIGITEYPDGSKGRETARHFQGESLGGQSKITAPSTPEAKLWEGYGTALKPAYEPILLCMKPLDGTFTNNALKHKVAGLNIDECRIKMTQTDIEINQAKMSLAFIGVKPFGGTANKGTALPPNQSGRFPSNFIHDGSQEVMGLFPDTKGDTVNRKPRGFNATNGVTNFGTGHNDKPNRTDSGSAARFFYCAKASRSERDAGLEDMPESLAGTNVKGYQGDGIHDTKPRVVMARNNHPTVKPLALMTYLCKLVKMPEYNLILDPFCGSGTILLACKKLGIPCIGIDSNEDYCEISKKRLSLME